MRPKTPKLLEVATAQDLRRLHALLSKAGLPADTFDAVPLSAAYSAVASVADRLFDFDYAASPESVLKSRAKAAGKPVHSEWASLQEVMQFLDDLPAEVQRTIQLQLVRKTLDESGDIEAAERRVDKWLAGDMEAWDAFAGYLERAYPEMSKRIGTDRNKAWVPRIKTIWARTQTAFVCVGVLHLAGTESIQAQLQRSGLTVLRV